MYDTQRGKKDQLGAGAMGWDLIVHPRCRVGRGDEADTYTTDDEFDELVVTREV